MRLLVTVALILLPSVADAETTVYQDGKCLRSGNRPAVQVTYRTIEEYVAQRLATGRAATVNRETGTQAGSPTRS
jgi:hypothetical protein